MIEQYFIKRGNMDLIVAYQDELLAFLAILIVIFIYIIIKRTKATSTSQREKEAFLAEVTQMTDNVQESLEKESESETEEPESASITLLDGKEEGNFGIEEQKPETTNPIEKKAIKKRAVPSHAKITKDDFKEFSGLRILLAEDNIINQKVILGLLAESGIEIIIANDGVEALEILEKDDNFTVILMDAHMPRIDGFEATRKIRANPDYDHIVVVALSGDTAVDDIRKMSEAGMSEHLEKPLKMDALYDIFYAYSQEKTLDQTPLSFHELNVDKGMEISGDDSIFYHEILNEFIDSYGDAHTVIDRLIKHHNIQDADRLLLDIIGVSANIGADKLTKTAGSLKNSLNSNDNEKSRLLFQFKEDLENLIKEIKNYLHTKS